jgi:hypothetical protein
MGLNSTSRKISATETNFHREKQIASPRFLSGHVLKVYEAVANLVQWSQILIQPIQYFLDEFIARNVVTRFVEHAFLLVFL